VSAEGRTFRRSLSIRVLSLLTTLFLAGAVASRLLARELGPGLWVIASLGVVGLIGVIGAWGDRIRLDDEGVEVRNQLGSLLGLPGRRLAWRDVVAVREHRRPRPGGEAAVSALFLVPRTGRRLVLDSLVDFEEARSMAVRLHRAAQEAVSDAAGRRPGACGPGVSTPPPGPPR
jgi:hypothetical protein